MASKYDGMKKMAEAQLADVDARMTKLSKEREALVKVIDGTDDLIALETGNGERPEPIEGGRRYSSVDLFTGRAAARLAADGHPTEWQQSLIEMAVEILRSSPTPLRGSDILDKIQTMRGRKYDYSSLAKALQRDSEDPKGVVTRDKVRGPWRLR